MRWSKRYARATFVLLLMGAVAPVSGLWLDRRADECIDPDGLRAAFRPGTEKLREIDHDVSGIDQWTAGRLRESSGQFYTSFRLIRSYAPNEVLLQPTRFAERNGDFKGMPRPIELDTPHGSLPAWLLSVRTDVRTRTVAYFQTQGEVALRSPLWAHLGTIWRGWCEGVSPLRLYLVTVDAARGRDEATEERARAWLVRAYERHQAVCRS